MSIIDYFSASHERIFQALPQLGVPPPLGDWREALRLLAADCMDGSPDEAEALARRFQSLTSRCDGPAKFHVGCDYDLDVFEARLSVGCCFEAVQLIAGSELGYMLSRSREGLVVATVKLPNWSEEVTLSASCESNAMVGSVAAALWQATEAWSH